MAFQELEFLTWKYTYWNAFSSFGRPNIVDPPKQDESVPTHNFKALPLNKKVSWRLNIELLFRQFCKLTNSRFVQILSSRGDMGVFRNIKKEITVPMVVHAWIMILGLVPLMLFYQFLYQFYSLKHRNLIFILRREFINIIHQLNSLTR